MSPAHARLVLYAICCGFVLTACSAKPLPPEKAQYAGDWQGLGMSLIITPDGSVAYRRLKGGGSVSVNGPINRYQGDNFCVGMIGLTTCFVEIGRAHV